MDQVDLQRRREGHGRRKPEAPQRSVARDPFLLVGTGFALGSLISYCVAFSGWVDPNSFLLPLVASLLLLLVYSFWRFFRRGTEIARPKLGSEKQLLLAILDAGGSMTPVEAALETSLTVDEAEEILTRLADRGHLVVQSQDGALSYALPGRRTAPETPAV